MILTHLSPARRVFSSEGFPDKVIILAGIVRFLVLVVDGLVYNGARHTEFLGDVCAT